MLQKKGPYFLDTYFLLAPADTQICQKKLQTNSSIEHYQAGLAAKNTRKPPSAFHPALICSKYVHRTSKISGVGVH